MNRIEEIRVLLLNLVSEHEENYVEKLLDELQREERGIGYGLFNKLCSRVANSVFNGHKEVYPSNALDYMSFLCYGMEQHNGWKPNERTHKRLIEYYEDSIKEKLNE